jgi:1,4-alpha-glucan branching enzyme
MKRVRFSLEAPNASKVLLVGDFTDWQARAKAMRKEKAGGRTFTATVNLPPGTYQYKFIVDGKWVDDPKATSHVANPFGSQNSLLTVRG